MATAQAPSAIPMLNQARFKQQMVKHGISARESELFPLKTVHYTHFMAKQNIDYQNFTKKCGGKSFIYFAAQQKECDLD